MANNPTAIILGASTEEFAHVDRCLPDWECASIPLRGDKVVASLIPVTAKLTQVQQLIPLIEVTQGLSW